MSESGSEKENMACNDNRTMVGERDVVKGAEDPQPSASAVDEGADEEEASRIANEAFEKAETARIEAELRDRASLLCAQGNELFRQQQWKQAIDLYDQAIDVCPAPVEMRFLTNKATALYSYGDIGGALAVAKEAVTIDEHCDKAHKRMGKCFLQLGLLREAHNAFEMITEDATTEIDICRVALEGVHTADAHVRAGDIDAALQCYDEVLGVHAGYMDALCGKTGTLLDAGDLEGARVVLSVAMGNSVRAEEISMNYSRAELIMVLQTQLMYLDLPPIQSPWDHFAKAAGQSRRAHRLFPRNASLTALAKEAMQLCNTFDKLRRAVPHIIVEATTEELERCPSNKGAVALLYCYRAEQSLMQEDAKQAAIDSTLAITTIEAVTPTAKGVNNKMNLLLKARTIRGYALLDLKLTTHGVRDLEFVWESNEKQGVRDDEVVGRLEKAQRELQGVRNHYATLGLEKTTSLPALKKAYRKLALKWHPDKNVGCPGTEFLADAMFKEISVAYDTLSDPLNKKKYDIVSSTSKHSRAREWRARGTTRQYSTGPPQTTVKEPTRKSGRSVMLTDSHPVYVRSLDAGRVYHIRRSCGGLSFTMPFGDAKAQGRLPCSLCS